MNARLLACVILLLPAATAAPPAIDVENSHLALVQPDYKRPVAVAANFFNPFKIQAVADSEAAHHDVAAIKNETVLDALTARGLSGLLYASRPALNRVIVGDDIFLVGDELQFSSDTGNPLPLVTGATVILRAVDAEKLILEVTPAGEPARTLTYPLRAFWRP